MPAPKQPEQGIRSPYKARYRLNIPACTGLDTSDDPSTISDTALVDAINVRVHDGIVQSRGGQTQVATSGNARCIQALIDIDGVGTRAVLADNETGLGGSGNQAGILFFDEGAPTVTATIDNKVVPHPAQGNTDGYDAYEDDKVRYVYTWWDGNIVFQDQESGELHKIILPEDNLDDMDEVQVEALFPCSVPGEGGFTVSSLTTMTSTHNRLTEPLYFGTLNGGVVGYVNGEMYRLLPDSTITGRVLVFQYNNRLYAAGANALWVQNGWAQGLSAVSTSWTQVSLPAGPTDWRPMSAIEWGGYGWIGGYDLDTVGPAAVNSGYILKVSDSGGTPAVAVGVNDVTSPGEYLQSVDDLGVGLSDQLIVAYRVSSGGSFFGGFGAWDGVSAGLPNIDFGRSWGEAGGMCQRVQGNNSKVYAVGYGADSNTSLKIWDGTSVTTGAGMGSAGTQSPFDMVLF